jgi:iron complex outermembrane receptor protein
MPLHDHGAAIQNEKGDSMTISGQHAAASKRLSGNGLRSAALLGVVVASVIARVAVAASALDKEVTLDIAPQALDSALLQFSKQSGVQIMLAADSVHQQMTPGIKGTLSAGSALKRLLDDSGLSYKASTESVLILPIDKAQRLASAENSGTTTVVREAAATSSSATDADEQSATESSATPEEQSKEKGKLQEVVVTGTHIAGASPASPVITITRSQIDQSGYGDVGEVIRSLPQDFSGGQNPGVVGANGSNNTASISSASSPNLRGLGQDSTLTLIDGLRFAYDGTTNGVDLSVIPLAAVERIEVLTDGASAIYGSDAVAGVTNVILRNDYDGLETSARVGDSAGGGGFQQQYSILGGHDWSSGNALLTYEYSMTDPLYASERSFSSSAAPPQSLYPELHRNSVFGKLNQDLSDDLTVFAEGLYTSRSSNSVNNSTVATSYFDTDVTQYGISTGMKAVLPQNWTAAVDATFSRDRDTLDGEDFSDTNGLLTSADIQTQQNDLWIAEARAGGPLFNLPSGPVGFATGAGFRSEEFKAVYSNSAVADSDASRHVRYAYGELQIPVIEPSTTRLGLERLDLNAASRYEDYNDFGSKTTSKVGLVYVPQNDITLHATWSQSFRAPELLDVYGPQQLYLVPTAITKAVYGGVAGTNALLQNGSNPNLSPETATSRTVGLDFAPTWRPTLKVSATYFDIDYLNRLVEPIANVVGVLKNPTYAPFVIDNPSAQQQQSVVSTATFFTTYGAQYNPALVSAIVENNFQNATSQTIHGVDLTAQDSVAVGLGKLLLAGNASWLSIQQKLISTVPEMAVSGTIFNPPNFKARSSATWQVGPWSLTTTGNYIRGEWDTSTTPYTRIASWTTFDAQIAYKLPAAAGSRFLSGWQISVSAINIFDRDPPHVADADTGITGLGYDSTNASPFGRFVSGYISKKW